MAGSITFEPSIHQTQEKDQLQELAKGINLAQGRALGALTSLLGIVCKMENYKGISGGQGELHNKKVSVPFSGTLYPPAAPPAPTAELAGRWTAGLRPAHEERPPLTARAGRVRLCRLLLSA